MTKKKRVRAKQVPLTKIGDKWYSTKRVCSNCKAIIPSGKGLCSKCFMLKIQGKKIKEKWK